MTLDIQQIESVLSSYNYQTKPTISETRWAGVAVVLRQLRDEPLSVLLIERSENPNDPWSGHMAMPGGKMDSCDATTRHAAERETKEEVGLDLRILGRHIGRLDDVTAVARGKQTGLIIVPWVYELTQEVTLSPNHEVQETVWIPLGDLMSNRFRDTLPYDLGGTQLLLPCWRWNGRVIWGLTYGMLDTLFRVIS
jgi:8-oxo-dGTP pyrophosphatase MutT (NUDIX family)